MRPLRRQSRRQPERRAVRAQRDPAGQWPRDPRIRPAMIGENPLVEIGVRKLNQLLGVEIEYFATLEEALDWARDDIRRQSDPPPD
jgi:hypothetical protein